MPVTDRVSFQLYSARKFPPLDSQLATLVEARLQERRALWRPLPEPGRAEGGAEEAQARDADGAYRHRPAAQPTSRPSPKSRRTSASSCSSSRRSPQEERTNSTPTAGPSSARSSPAIRRSSPRTASTSPGTTTASSSPSSPTAAIRSTTSSPPRPASTGRRISAGSQWAGEDPGAWIKKYCDRVTALHVKDLAPKGENADEDGQADVGHGVLDWKKLMPAIKAPGVKYLVMEHDNPNDFERFARRSYETVSAW